MRYPCSNGVGFSERYWRILLGPWLLYYIHTLNDRYMSLKRALASNGELKTIALSPSNYKTPVETMDFVNLAFGESADIFNLQLYSQTLRALCLDEAIVKEAVLPRTGSTITQVSVKGAKGTCRLKWLARKLTDHTLGALTQLVRPSVMLGDGRANGLG